MCGLPGVGFLIWQVCLPHENVVATARKDFTFALGEHAHLPCDQSGHLSCDQSGHLPCDQSEHLPCDQSEHLPCDQSEHAANVTKVESLGHARRVRLPFLERPRPVRHANEVPRVRHSDLALSYVSELVTCRLPQLATQIGVRHLFNSKLKLKLKESFTFRFHI